MGEGSIQCGFHLGGKKGFDLLREFAAYDARARLVAPNEMKRVWRPLTQQRHGKTVPDPSSSPFLSSQSAFASDILGWRPLGMAWDGLNAYNRSKPAHVSRA